MKTCGLLVLLFATGCLSQEITRVTENSTVTLSCNFGQAITVCLWDGPDPDRKLIFGIKMDQKNPKGYRVEADASSGKCDLVVESAKDEDDGIWKCSAPETIGAPDRECRLLAIAFPRNSLTNNASEDITGQEKEVTPDGNGQYKIYCLSTGGRPKPNAFGWTVNGVAPLPADITTQLEPDVNGVSMSVLTVHFPKENAAVAYFRLIPDPDTKRQVVCTVFTETYATGEAPPVSVTVGIPYEVTNVSLVEEVNGTEHILTCSANGFPEPSYKIWKIDATSKDKIGEPFLSNRMTATEDGVYICEANSDGKNPKNSTEVTVSVEYKVSEISLTFDAKEHLLTCSANGLPAPTYEISRIDAKTKEKIGEAVRSNKMTVTVDGVYICTASNKVKDQDYSTNSAEVTVTNEYPVTSVSLAEELDGKNHVLNCSAYGVPEPTYEIWRIDSSTKEPLGEISKTNRLKVEEDGVYVCNATNTANGETYTVTSKEVTATAYNSGYALRPELMTLLMVLLTVTLTRFLDIYN